MTTKILQQGEADGLCGIYCVLNFLRRDKGWRGGDKPDANLRCLLESCQRLGFLKPETITGGFEDFQLKAVLDDQIASYRLNYRTFFLDDVVVASKVETFRELIKLVCEDRRGSMICHWAAANHWVLIRNVSGTVSVLDSAKPQRPIDVLGHPDRKFSLHWGVVILPMQRPLIELDS